MDFRINKYQVATSPAETLSRAPSLSRLPRPACTSHARWRVPPLPPHRSAHGSPPGRAWAPLSRRARRELRVGWTRMSSTTRASPRPRRKALLVRARRLGLAGLPASSPSLWSPSPALPRAAAADAVVKAGAAAGQRHAPPTGIYGLCLVRGKKASS